MSLPLLIQFALCPIVLLSLLWVTAPYGRHFRSGWGRVLPNRLAWVLMEIPALGVIALVVLSSGFHTDPNAWVPLLLWLGHYAYRTVVFPLLMRPSHSTFPAMLVMFAIGFNVLNGWNNGVALAQAGERDVALISGHFLVGTVIFVLGFAVHLHSDRLIRQLRMPGESSYGIPRGGLFRWISSPHYLGEIVQWTGWAILTWSLAGAAFALFTLCNLLPRAIANHNWYLKKFADYPADRRIILPGLY